jgi:acetyl-CoA synthetase
VYVTADFAMKDKDGDFWIEGRMDDVLNVSGHRLGSAEIESALVSHHDVAEAAVVGVADNIKGQSIAAFVTLKDRVQTQIKDQHLRVATIKSTLRDHVGNEIGAFAKPDQIRLASALPKTRSGKIMRRLLRELATTGEMRGDTSTLEDFSPQSAIDEE